jgi:hypothetical protein
VSGLLRRRARASPDAVFGSRAPRIEVNEAGEEPPISLVGRRLEIEGHCAKGVGSLWVAASRRVTTPNVPPPFKPQNESSSQA